MSEEFKNNVLFTAEDFMGLLGEPNHHCPSIAAAFANAVYEKYLKRCEEMKAEIEKAVKDYNGNNRCG